MVLTANHRSCEEWQLFTLAADFSLKVYPDSTGIIDDEMLRPLVVRPKGDIKSYIIYEVDNHGQKTLIVAVRGSSGWYDWMVNANCAPSSDSVSLSHQ